MSNLIGWLHRDVATAYEAPTPAARARLHRLIDGGEPVIGSDVARKLRWHVDAGTATPGG